MGSDRPSTSAAGDSLFTFPSFTFRVHHYACLLIVLVAAPGCRVVDRRFVAADLLSAAVAGADAVDARDVRLERLATTDPLAFLAECIDHYDTQIRDYRCRFLTRERLNGQLGEEQEMTVLFREEPFSVDVRWERNARLAERVNYVAGRWERGNRQYAYIEPAGMFRLLAPQGIRRDIHAPDVRAAARRTIDQFGFRNTLEWIIEDAERARGHPDYAMNYLGMEVFDDRPCFVLERTLPYDKHDDAFPDRLMRIYIDREWLVPLASFSYTDEAGRILLGSYVSREVEFNIGLGDDDFAVRPIARPEEESQAVWDGNQHSAASVNPY